MQGYSSSPDEGAQLAGREVVRSPGNEGLAGVTAAADPALVAGPGAAVGAGPLGIHAKNASIVSNPDNVAAEWAWVCRRFALQGAAVELVPEMRIRGCMRWPFEQAVRVLTGGGTACYRGLQTCGSVWNCAVCASRVSEERRKELTAAIAPAPGRGLVPYLLTFTVRHQWADELGTTVDGLIDARRRSRNGRAGVELRELLGLVGSVRALEVTHGQNGWHPHIHELAFLEREQEPAELERQLLPRWAAAVKRAGLRDVNEHGVRVQRANSAVSGYVAKFGTGRAWGAADELAKAVAKVGREGHRTPVDLLWDAGFEGDTAAASLWQHYARTFFRRRQLVWSNGLRELLGLGQERTDEEIAADAGEKCRIVAAVLSVRQWRGVVGNDARGELLAAAASGGAAAVWSLLRAWGLESTAEELMGFRDQRRGGEELC